MTSSHNERASTDQSPPDATPSQDLTEDLEAADLKDAADTGPDVRTPEPTEQRQGEAGNAYVGREMDDDLQANPRIEDVDRVRKDDDS